MTDAAQRKELLKLLAGVDAHMTFEEAVADFPDDAINRKPPNVSYTPWHLIEHIRLTQWDILDYVRNRDYVERSWPDEYWPDPDASVVQGLGHANRWRLTRPPRLPDLLRPEPHFGVGHFKGMVVRSGAAMPVG